MLPNLIVIGAPKAGTTSLHYYLGLHPEIFMSPTKELRFFVDGPSGNWSRGLGWYEAQFADGTPVRGESTPDYTIYPSRPSVPERMASVVPEAKLVYLVRDPIERLVADYRFARWLLATEALPLGEVIADLDGSRYVAASRYAMQLDRYLAHYPLERILVVDQADLLLRRRETLRRVFEFLGVDPAFSSRMFRRRLNRTERGRRNLVGKIVLDASHAVIGRRATRAIRDRTPFMLSLPLHGRVGEVDLDPLRHPALVECLRDDAARLRASTGQAFAHWCV